jgi:hypothetical protein
MIMIEHFSNWVELVALPDKSSHNTNHVFLQHVLSRFGACVECLIDQGSKFRGKFQDLLDHALIDHCQTSKDHPQADGLVERMIKTCNKGLRKICLTRNKEDWELVLTLHLHGLQDVQTCLFVSFLSLLSTFGRHPIPPFSIATQMDEVMDLDSPATWARVIAEKATLFRKVMPMALENLSIAQHRDTLWYAHTRSGNYKPKVKQFDVGDFMYLQQQPNDTFDTSFSRTILRIKAIRPLSVLELQRADERIIQDHSKNCAPCHLLNLDPTIIMSTWIPPLNYPCRYFRGQTMLIRCCFAITIMVDTIFFASSRSSLKFPPTFGNVHHVFLQYLDFYSNHAMLFPVQVLGGRYMRISFQPPFVHYTNTCACISFWLISLYF